MISWYCKAYLKSCNDYQIQNFNKFPWKWLQPKLVKKSLVLLALNHLTTSKLSICQRGMLDIGSLQLTVHLFPLLYIYFYCFFDFFALILLKSVDLGGILNKLHPIMSIVYFATTLLCDECPSLKNTLIFGLNEFSNINGKYSWINGSSFSPSILLV